MASATGLEAIDPSGRRRHLRGSTTGIRALALIDTENVPLRGGAGPPLQRSRLSLCRRLCAEDALEACAILQKNKNPEHRGYQCWSNARRRKREMKREDVIKLRRKHRERERHKE